MACTVERLRQAARNVPVVLLLGRLKNSAWVGSIPPVLLALSRATSAERARARIFWAGSGGCSGLALDRWRSPARAEARAIEKKLKSV